MGQFELSTLTEYDDNSLLKELRRVATLIPEGKLTCAAFDKVSKVHSSTICHRFGSWKRALITAGLGDRFDDSTSAWSKDEVIQELRRVSAKIASTVVRKSDLLEHAGISDRP